MGVIDARLTRGDSAGAMLGFLTGGSVFIPKGYVYGRLIERMPDAGSEVAWMILGFGLWKRRPVRV
jgi:amino acid transporter